MTNLGKFSPVLRKGKNTGLPIFEWCEEGGGQPNTSNVSRVRIQLVVNIYRQTDQTVLQPVLLPTMTLNQRPTLLLLLGLTIISGAAASLCILDVTRCMCNTMVIRNPQSLTCTSALELELRDGRLDAGLFRNANTFLNQRVMSFLLQLDELTFNNVTIATSFLGALISFLPLSDLNKINIISSSLEVDQRLGDLRASTIQNLLLDDITVDPSLLQPSFQSLHRWMFGSLKSFVLVRSGLVETDCSWARRAENLVQLDLSENPISFTSLQRISHCSSLSFMNLTSLHLSRTNLTSLQSLCTLMSLTPVLSNLDVSRNSFSTVHFPHCLQVKLLRRLNLSHSGITEINSLLSTSLEELDLSYNSLEVFSSPPQTLKKLNLSNNHLIRLPPLGKPSQLQELRVDSNQLIILINETGVGLSTLEQLEILRAGRNPYQCDCSLKETILFLSSTDRVLVEDFPQEYLCASPVDQRGTQIRTLSLETCGTQRHGSPLCLTLFMGLLSHLIYYW